MKKDLCRSLFSLFSGWCGPLAKHLGTLVPQPPTQEIDDRLNLSALKVHLITSLLLLDISQYRVKHCSAIS